MRVLEFSNYLSNDKMKGLRSLLILMIMAVGVILGLKWFPRKWAGSNAKLQVVFTSLLIFCMGVSLGSRPHFFYELKTMGIQALVYSFLPIVISVFVVYGLTELFMKEKKEEEKE